MSKPRAHAPVNARCADCGWSCLVQDAWADGTARWTCTHCGKRGTGLAEPSPKPIPAPEPVRKPDPPQRIVEPTDRLVTCRPLDINRVIERACVALGVAASDLHSSSRHKAVVLARRVIIGVGRSYSALSYPELAVALRLGSHTSVMQSHRKLKTILDKRVGEIVGPDPALPDWTRTMTVAALMERVAQESR